MLPMAPRVESSSSRESPLGRAPSGDRMPTSASLSDILRTLARASERKLAPRLRREPRRPPPRSGAQEAAGEWASASQRRESRLKARDGGGVAVESGPSVGNGEVREGQLTFLCWVTESQLASTPPSFRLGWTQGSENRREPIRMSAGLLPDCRSCHSTKASKSISLLPLQSNSVLAMSLQSCVSALYCCWLWSKALAGEMAFDIAADTMGSPASFVAFCFLCA
mmetsp:Transcript_12148/g.30438  ORF Transcript_12148/g.30438 Transcript_12148/m.30438 type:complete len:224 (-) Transcript_12148:557-1228(-)